MTVFGRNPVREALKSGRPIEKIMVQDGARNSCSKILALAKDKGVRVEYVPKKVLDKASDGGAHQGICCSISAHEYKDIDEIISGAKEDSILVLLDEIEDPHNLGAIMRTAECAGADGVVVTKRRSAGLTDTVAKTSAGAIEYMPCARVNNMADTVDKLKAAGYWICAADMDGESIWSCDLKGKLAIVIGNEGRGVSRLVKERCDFVASIPMVGNINSLNASNAAAVLLYEALRQREASK